MLNKPPREAAMAIHPASSRGGLIGVALVPVELHRRASFNGVPLRSGACGLRHADRLEVYGHSLWIAANSSVEPTAYDPAIHGEGLVCFLTKAPLQKGESVVLCPGAPGKPCSVIYKQESWEMAMQSTTRLRCTNCNFRPDEAPWRPPVDHPSKRIDDLLAIHTHERS